MKHYDYFVKLKLHGVNFNCTQSMSRDVHIAVAGSCRRFSFFGTCCSHAIFIYMAHFSNIEILYFTTDLSSNFGVLTYNTM